MQAKPNFPIISIGIPTLNNERDIGSCLKSVFMQEYPHDLIDLIIVDGGSTDNTLEICHRFPVRIHIDPKANSPEKAKMIAYRLSKGEIFLFLDADMRLPRPDWLRKMINPLCEHNDVVASFTMYLVDRNDPSLNRCLSYHPSQCDPFLGFLYPRSSNVFEYRSQSYARFDFAGTTFPPIGFLVYRKEILGKVLPKTSAVLLDIDLPNKLIQSGYTKFAYVSNTGLFHLHALNLRQLLRKRIRNIDNRRGSGFLPFFGQRSFLWVDPRRAADVAKLLFWMIYSNLLIPHIFIASYKSIKFRDIACMWEAILAPLVTDAVLFAVLRNSTGRKLLWETIASSVRAR